MWECKDKRQSEFPSIEKSREKMCNVEICPMEHWVESQIWGAEWEIYIPWGCPTCPLRTLKEVIINDIQRITGGNDVRNEGKESSEEKCNC